MITLRPSLIGNGEMQCENAFVSPRVVRDALVRRFRLVPLEESGSYLSYKLPRYFRLYGGPIVWPQASLHILISRDGPRTTLSWRFRWPEYYLPPTWLLGVLCLFLYLESALKGDPSFFIYLFVFALVFTLIVFLDTQWVAHRVRRALERIVKDAQE